MTTVVTASDMLPVEWTSRAHRLADVPWTYVEHGYAVMTADRTACVEFVPVFAWNESREEDIADFAKLGFVPIHGEGDIVVGVYPMSEYPRAL